MRNIALILLIFLSVFVKSFSQIIWAPQTAKWTYSGQGQIISYIEIEYEKDSLVLEKLSSVLIKKLYIWDEYQKEVVVSNLGKEITYVEDSVVYLYTYNQFDTLCNFNSTIGDSWILYCHPNTGICDENATVTVNDTGTVQINDIDLKYIAVTYNFDTLDFDEAPYIVYDTIIERIGSTSLYFLPWDIVNSRLDANEGSKLRCYYDLELGEYSNNYDQSCDHLTSLNNNTIPDIKIYPNPCSEYLNVDIADIKEKYLKILNIYGEELLIKKIEGDTDRINLSFLPDGILFLEITTSKGKFYKKVVKI
ncbi:hypothetical protein ES705_14152 [subsurface metagenome]